MSRLRLTLRLAGRDLRRRSTETLLLLAALVVAATTLTIGLVLHGQTAAPYAETRQRTTGPDIVATVFPAAGHQVSQADLARLGPIAHRPEVAAHTSAFPVTWTSIDVHGVAGVAQVQGRDIDASPVDRPRVTSGHWVSDDGIVVERAFAQALGVAVGDTADLDGKRVPVVGIAVSAALPPYPQLCTIGCIRDRPEWRSAQPGLVWATRDRVTALATAQEPLVWFQYLTLRDPSSAPALARLLSADGAPDGHPQLVPWQDIRDRQAEQLTNERAVVVFGSTLLVVLALATLVVLVGGRMADEVRRVGTLKASGATPGFVARVLLVSYMSVGTVAALLGLLAGRLIAPVLVSNSAGVLGHVGGTSLTGIQVLVVLGTSLAIVASASVVPAWRAARTSTVRALADSGHAPHRGRLLLALSAKLPTPALLGVRLAGRRPRRTALTVLSIAVADCGSVVALYAQASLHAERGAAGGPADPQAAQLHTVMLAVTVLLSVMTAVNLLFVSRATATDARTFLAVARTLGASPNAAAAGLSIAQVVPAALGSALGAVAGSVLFRALSVSHPVTPPLLQLVALGILTVVIVVALTALPALTEARRPIAGILRES